MSLRKPESKFYNSYRSWPTRIGNKKIKACQLWENIRQRVDCDNFHASQPTYKSVSICDEWLDYQNFCDWFDEQVKSGGYKEGWHLDKDVLSPIGAKIYSPTTCVFLPKDLNNVLVNNRVRRGSYPLGTTLHRGKFYVRVYRGSLGKLDGKFDNKQDAFNFYKLHKESYVKYLVKQYEHLLPTEVVEFFNRFEVNIDD